MRTLEEIERDLASAKTELASAKGTPTEVYSRIVGYYRSVRNWNRGKREEYGERVLYDVRAGVPGRIAEGRSAPSPAVGARVLLFVRAACPACPPAKDAAAKLPVEVELVDADTADGLARAERLNVYATPTAILLDTAGKEIRRARDAREITSFAAGAELKNAASL